jgi:hypothetical protein
MFLKRKLLSAALFGILLFSLSLMLVSAQTQSITLSDNKGDTSSTWFITGERTLVINGFDLTPLKLQLPATISQISIDVDKPVPGSPIDVVVYQDANGGSPIDATLVGRGQVDIQQAGVFTATLSTPAVITQPVVWLGFYLPPDFRFRADESGSSVLTYWGWTPGGTFDLSKLATAAIFGPADGSNPVKINMKGIARITAQITPGAAVPTTSGTPGTPAPTTIPVTVALTPGAPLNLITPIPGASDVNISVLQAYPPGCDTLMWDTADTTVTYRGAISPVCQTIYPAYAPPPPNGYIRKALILFDVTFYDDHGNVLTGYLPEPVTHCLQVPPEDAPYAVVGVASGSPRQWTVLPTLRVNNMACAEVGTGGNISYFIPAVLPSPTATFTVTPGS